MNRPTTAETLALRRRIAELEKENEALRDPPLLVDSFEACIKEGRFDMSVRAEWARQFAMLAGEYFVAERGKNYLEVNMNPFGPNIPEGFGELTITFQRANGKTPGMVAGDTKRHFNSRFRLVVPSEVVADRFYMVCIAKGVKVARRWNQAVGVVVGGQFMIWLKLEHSSNYMPADDEKIAEIYELIDPYTPRPEFLPEQGKRFVFASEALHFKPHNYPEVITDPPALRIGLIAKGRICRVYRVYHATGFRWNAVVRGYEAPVLSFPDDGGEVPDFLAPCPDDYHDEEETDE